MEPRARISPRWEPASRPTPSRLPPWTLPIYHSVYGRIYRQVFSDPLGCGKSPSRFSDPSGRIPDHRFGVLYLGSSLKVCFLEAVLRDDCDGVVGDLLLDEAELDTRSYAEIEVQTALRLIHLSDNGPVRMGIPSDVARSSDQGLARRWSEALHRHPAEVDAILYPSRLNGEINLAIYNRAISKLFARQVHALRRASGLAAVLNELKVALA